MRLEGVQRRGVQLAAPLVQEVGELLVSCRLKVEVGLLVVTSSDWWYRVRGEWRAMSNAQRLWSAGVGKE